MSDEKLEALIDNEREWRREMWKEVKSLRKDMTGLKIKVAAVAAGVGYAMSLVVPYLKGKL